MYFNYYKWFIIKGKLQLKNSQMERGIDFIYDRVWQEGGGEDELSCPL